MKLAINSFIAGCLIGLGVIINTLVQPPILGALLFSFGLLVIITLQLPLFTGKIGFLNKKEYNIKYMLIVCIWNFIGIFYCTFLYTLANLEWGRKLIELSEVKFSKTWYEMLIYGFFCGILIHLAVKCKEKPYLTSMAVIIFILIGAEHCVADFPYLMYNFTLGNGFKFIMVIIGNSLGAILLERGLSYYDRQICGNDRK